MAAMDGAKWPMSNGSFWLDEGRRRNAEVNTLDSRHIDIAAAVRLDQAFGANKAHGYFIRSDRTD
jgi:hypothetical protein